MRPLQVLPLTSCNRSLVDLLDARWEECYQNIKKQMSLPESEKDNIIRKRILKYFQNYQLATDLYYTSRQDIDPQNIDSSLIIESSLLLYGIDFLSLEKIKDYFNPF